MQTPDDFDKTSPRTSPFDAIRHEDESGQEYWSARELYKILGYSQWRNFQNVVVKRAMKACEENGRDTSDHFVRSYKMVQRVILQYSGIMDTVVCTEG